MDKSDQKVGKLFLVFAGVCIVILPLIMVSAFSYKPKETIAETAESPSPDYDHLGKTFFENYQLMPEDYLKGTSPARTLSEYYSRRQYPGSPPFIPHKTIDEEGGEMVCLTCHAKGGWTEELKRNTPLTPHPEHTRCRQCHVTMETESRFVEHDWRSVKPPRLGRSHLPGGPPPIPHELQMRENCVACHVGPGAVDTIRVDHPSRGDCRQCHVPDSLSDIFERHSEY